MATDRLSEAFDLFEVRGVLTGGIALVSGRARMATDGIDEPVDPVAGDVAILSGRSWAAFGAGAEPRQEVQPESDFSTDRFASADRDADDIVIGGSVSLNSAGSTLLLESLPPPAHIRSAGDDDRLLAALLRLFDEATAQRLGSPFAVRQYGQLFLLELLRSYVDRSALPSGWLRLLVDERLRPALDLLHGRHGCPLGAQRVGACRRDVPDDLRRAVPGGGRCATADLPGTVAHAARPARAAGR